MRSEGSWIVSRPTGTLPDKRLLCGRTAVPIAERQRRRKLAPARSVPEPSPDPSIVLELRRKQSDQDAEQHGPRVDRPARLFKR